VLDRERVRVVWTVDGWQTKHNTDARLIGYPGFSAELPIPHGAAGTLELTLYWPAEDRWLGRNYQVTLSEA
jgi:glucoamylase